ncbi:MULTISPECIES: ester cyclase [Marivita]|uniref:Ester cyclase n=1 Tax=Marivita cryptomonadis TaxID=505252 RepID=A0A9Q2NW66_9RHOB|nr:MULTISPECIES: ester cyclase [Marivita]MCR9170373.1 ester cyclase [Paracoccaceae bacterium]MBM2322329.1 ester cyclase [Marivita cryptomonadis]MBM2331911.1 ester cyclase [Marivita cryptomonadis]MBM2341495.1 ester cyclase [Marivita cryptomonadis]MBM2346159.1 ester cyclase [Marivita cryptomonadis]
MNTFKTTLAAASLGLASIATSAAADDMATVQTFYDLLSNPGSETHVAAFLDATTEDWESIGNYSGTNELRDEFVGQMGFFDQLMPDLEWSVQAMHQDGNFVTVRSRATGTPVGPLFGVDGEGRGFDILTIDIHELEDGKVIRTYHVEDWAGALQQLAGN